MNIHEKYMLEALKLAQTAFEEGEVPIGAVVVYNNQIIGAGYNKRQNSSMVHAHAEIEAMNNAADYLGSWNLEACTLYVNIEPCPMCSGAAIQSHISTVVYGANEPNSGSFGSVLSLHQVEEFNHSVEVYSGVLANEASRLMTDFFAKIRLSKVKVRKVDEHIFEMCLQLRMKVFVEEQGVGIDEEIDEYDDLSRNDVVHIAAIQMGKVLGTARYVIKNKQFKIGRVAVDKESRGLKVGTKLLQYIEIQALNNGIESLILGAQISATDFYKSLGFIEYGEIFDDAGIDHIMMKKQIKTTQNDE